LKILLLVPDNISYDDWTGKFSSKHSNWSFFPIFDDFAGASFCPATPFPVKLVDGTTATASHLDFGSKRQKFINTNGCFPTWTPF
jgi:hypothetical protein